MAGCKHRRQRATLYGAFREHFRVQHPKRDRVSLPRRRGSLFIESAVHDLVKGIPAFWADKSIARVGGPPEIEGEIKESDLRRESVSRRIDGSMGGRPCDIDQPPEETPTLLTRTSQCAKGERSLDPELVLGAPL